MSELKTAHANAFIGWGVFLLFLPAIAGTLFILTGGPSAYSWLILAIVFSYLLWGWASVIAGVILIVVGIQRKSNAAKLAQPQAVQPITEQPLS